MKKILSTLVMCLILGVGSVWAEQINVTLSAPDNTSNPLITQTMGNLGGENTLAKAWNNGEQTGLLLNKDLGIATSNKASITFSSPQYTIFHKYSFNVWKDGEYDVMFLKIIPYYGINTNNPDKKPTSKSAQNPQHIDNAGYTSNTLTFTTQRSGGKIGKLNFVYDIFSNNWTFGITIPEVIEPTDNPTTTLTKITASDLLEGKRTRTDTLTFTVKDPIGTNPTTIKQYFEASIIASKGSTWSLGDTWTVVKDALNYLVKIPVTFTATTDDPGDFEATVQLKPKHNVQYNGTDYSVGRTQIVKVAVNQQGTYAIDWKPDGWVNGGTITIFKGDFYERNDYLKNTDGLDLDIPKSSNSSVVSVDSKTGKITATEVGSTVLTYVQRGNDDYKDKTLTLHVDVIKRTPVFTLNSKSTYTENGNTYHVFYPNKSYPNFVTTTNGDLGNYPVTITPEGDMTNIISFNGVSAEVESALIDGIKITIFQQSGDLWDEKSQDFYISIRNNPMHVGALCEQSLEYLFENASAKYEAKYEGGAIVLGSAAINTNGGNITFRFEGTPDKLIWDKTTTQGAGHETWEVTQSDNGIDFIPLEDGTKFRSESRYVKLSISGTYEEWLTTYGVMGKITDLCITERVGVEILPAEIELVKMGNEVKSAAFSAKVSNLTNVVLTINSSDFGIARTESDEPQTSISLDYMDGLGIDQLATIPLVVKYKGVADDSAIGKTCIITANDAGGNQLAVANVKVTGMIMIDGVPQTILQSNATTTGIYTGTNKSSNDFPYHTKRQLDFSRCFDANTGMALFDILYIFGVTTNTDGGDAINAPTSNLGCNAKTPCYVYQKGNNGDRYEYQRTFDAASNRFDHGTTMSGKHLYFTGYCPFAYVGDQSTQNGWMYFEGNNGVSDQVDIYLDSCQIFARHKTPDGKYGTYNNYELVISVEQIGAGENKINYSYLSGYSSPFVFTSGTKNSGTSFRPTIHIAGKNHVKGQLGSKIYKTIADITPVIDKIPGGGLIPDDKKQINLGIGEVNTYSAPIAVKPTDVGQYTELTMTDIWKDNTITNGYIRLDAADIPGKVEEAALSIDLGSATGSLTINGGQYHMRNAAADGSYTCNLAVGYKTYGRSEQAFNTTLQAQLYGFGNDQADSKVTINSGTFTMYKNVYAGVLGTDYYKDQDNFLDLRLPAGTASNGYSRINGGTFNGISNVVTCKSTISTGADPINEQKLWLTLLDVPITGTNPDGSAQFSLDYIKDIQDAYSAYPRVTYTLVNDIDNVKNAIQYGGQSANAYKKTINGEEKNVVTLLLPGDLFGLDEKSEVLLRNWVTAVPYLEASKKLGGLVDVTLTQGGPINVDVSSASENIKYENKQLIFADLEGLEGYNYTLQAQGAGMKIKDNEDAFGQINNTDSYEITDNLNLLKVVQADTWYTFTAPFDVHEISVIEAKNSSYNESTIAAAQSRDEAMRLQAEANLHFMYAIYTFIVPNDEGRASSLTFNQLLANRQNKQKLVHYDGTNIMDANFYLYELDPKSLDANGQFSTDATGNALNIAWTPVATPAKGSPILTKGKVYAMQFPWCPMCNDLASRTYYDYWSNKMILFYGAGAQTIEGSSLQSTILSAPAEGKKAKLTGNSTFAKMTLTAQTAYVHNTANDLFELNTTSYPLKPTEGFMLYNPGGSKMPARISRSGKIEYDENVETSVGGVPTVGDRTSLMLFGAYDGFEILSLCEQLVTVYNLQGNIIFQQYMTEGEQVYVGTGAGIFVVRGESEAIKVMVE